MKQLFKKQILCWSIIAISISSIAQIPNGYYNGTENLTGTQLQSKLHTIIDDHDALSYSQTWDAYYTTDKKANGKVWDMYSDVPNGTPPYNFTLGSDQCGSYSDEGDCYNREHTFPQSWFNEQAPMKSDLFHLYPTDGYVNNRRSNYPMGDVGSASWTSENGCKLGSCSNSGYSGTVFEPIDDYKGDFARSFFYMAVRYYNEDDGWDNTDMTNGSQLKSWAMNALQQWHLNDPVSQKEIDRNNAVYAIQGNRNPFIDCPSFVGRIWDGPATSQPIYDECFPAPATCDPPTNVTATAHERSISISWTTVPAALSYSIFVNDQLLDEDITTTNYDDTNLSEGTYCYSIVAFCSNEESDPSNDACATITIDNIVENTDFANIYPNPVSSALTIQTNNACHASLYDIFGRCIHQQYISDTETLLDMQSLPQGIYILKMQSVNSELIYSYKIVK